MVAGTGDIRSEHVTHTSDRDTHTWSSIHRIELDDANLSLAITTSVIMGYCNIYDSVEWGLDSK